MNLHQHEKSFIHSPCDQDGHNHFWPYYPYIFLSTLNFWYQHVKKYLVVLTHVGIQLTPTWLPTWNAKPLYRVGTFLPTWFFSATSKVQNYQNKTPEKSFYPSKYVLTTYLKEFQRHFQIYLFYYLSLANCKLRKCNRLYRLLLPAMFFSIDIRSNHVRVDLII